jgi:broad specificity phosphatase PhoE
MKPVRIGLIRHFEVTQPMPAGWLSAADLTRWLTEYNRAGVIARPLDLGGIAWGKCFSSDLPRAYTTAQAAFSGPIRQMPELREPNIVPVPMGNLRLPLTVWRLMLHLAWLSSHSSQLPAKTDFLRRLDFLKTEVLAKAEENTLIVSHAGMMAFLRKELMALGFHGPSFRLAENGKLYVFEKRRSS